jgi:hypothetical protein
MSDKILTFSTTSMRSSVVEYPTPGWVNFQSATLGQFSTGGNIAELDEPTYFSCRSLGPSK